MGIQTDVYTESALSSKTFQSTKHIATKAHVAVWQRRKDNGTWEQLNNTDFELINNFCVLEDTVNTALYDSIEIRVADTPDELGTSLSDISVVAGIASSVVNVSSISNDVVTLSNNTANINSIIANKANIDTVANDIYEVNVVATAINTGAGLGGSQFLGQGLLKGVQYMSNSSEANETITVPSGTNAFSVDSFTLEDGASIVVPDNSTYKVI